MTGGGAISFTGDRPGQFARACPRCGAVIEFLEWPGDERCPQCAATLFVNGSGQVGAEPPVNVAVPGPTGLAPKLCWSRSRHTRPTPGINPASTPQTDPMPPMTADDGSA
jgi:hypothetical protein